MLIINCLEIYKNKLIVIFFHTVWNVATKKLEQELPGHADEVFAVDWASDGSRVASGGKDKIIKLWAY